MNRPIAWLGVAALGLIMTSVTLWPHSEPSLAVVSAEVTPSPKLDVHRSAEALARHTRREEERRHARRGPRRGEGSSVGTSDDLSSAEAVGAAETRGERLAALEEEVERDHVAHEERLRGNIESLQAAAGVALGEGRNAQAELLLTRAQNLEARLEAVR